MPCNILTPIVLTTLCEYTSHLLCFIPQWKISTIPEYRGGWMLQCLGCAPSICLLGTIRKLFHTPARLCHEGSICRRWGIQRSATKKSRYATCRIDAQPVIPGSRMTATHWRSKIFADVVSPAPTGERSKKLPEAIC